MKVIKAMVFLFVFIFIIMPALLIAWIASKVIGE